MKGKKKWLFCFLLLFSVTILLSAEEASVSSENQIEEVLTMIWLVVAGAMVFFMQAGFSMVEIGLTRAKNAGNIIMKNLVDFAVGALAYFAVGWAFMYGESAGGAGIIGSSQFFLHDGSSDGIMAWIIESGASSTLLRDWFFQVVFAATAATIVSGAVAGRTKFKSYIIFSVIISAFIYPVSGHWIWNGGWLAQLGFYDFAGSTVVHSVGGWAALTGAIILGARTGKYVKIDGRFIIKAIPGHNLPLAALGVFILWFGWYGFNAGSTLSGTDTAISHVVVTTTLAASAGTLFALFTSWIWYKKPDPSMSLNGALAGLVGITAGTAVISPVLSILVGAIAGILVVLSVEFFDKVLHIDDPVGAISVHGVGGVWGTISVGLFGNMNAINSATGLDLTRLEQIGVQALGIVSVMAWVSITSFALFFLLKRTIGLRVSVDEERKGLDLEEHGCEAYSGFQIFSDI